MTDTAQPMPRIRTASDPVWRIVTGTGAFALGVFISGSVASYSLSDPSWNAATGADIANLFGSQGAVFADFARQSLGWSSWVGGISLMIGGAMRAVLIGRPMRRRWLLGACAVPLSAACFAAWPVPASWPLASGLGGVVGDSMFSLAVMPFRALLLPAPEALCGVALGSVALYCGLSAMGFARSDARALKSAAAHSGRGAARKASGFGRGTFRWVGSALDAIKQRRPRWNTDDDYMDMDSRAASDRIIVPEPDMDKDDYVVPDLDEMPEPEATPELKPRTTMAKPGPKVRPRSKPAKSSGKLPPMDLLTLPPEDSRDVDEDALIAKAGQLGDVLKEFGVRGRIKEVRPGPVVTLFEMEPAPGVKSARVISLADDIARSMSAASARVAVVPGKNAIGIELPNDGRETVYLRTLLEGPAYQQSKAKLPMALGADIGGTPMVVELAKMPHLLIAGTTGSGKSVGVNAMILSLMYRLPPEQCRFIMIDPKMLELSIYEGIPHLLSPVVTDPTKAVNALKWAVREMEGRYELMSKAGVRNLAGFNDKAAKYRASGQTLTRSVQTGFDEHGKPLYETEHLPIDHIPNIVIVIDEMADLMMVAGKEIEGCVQRLAQMARAAGIHLITATQRPSVDVITGTIKANFPTRISYMVTTKIDSRTILGEQGAEQLLGMGDLLYQAPGGKTKRCHGPFVSDEEVEAIADWLRDQGEPDYVLEILEEAEESSPVMDAMLGTSGGGGEDDLYEQAKAVVIRDNRASTSYVQRRLKIGYNKAATLIERLEEDGVISGPNHAGKREVLKKDPE
ncbi:MAG: DNA translocase FtsK 4TM domain-containing protein [Pseudomonadota bacterium]